MVFLGKKFRKKKNAPDVIDLVVDLNMDSLNVNIRCDLRELSSVSVVGGKVEFSSRKICMDIDCKLNDVIVLDLDPTTVHKKVGMAAKDNKGVVSIVIALRLKAELIFCIVFRLYRLLIVIQYQ